jgi:hypothetical protein
LPPWTAVDQEFSFYPHVTPDSDSPENMPLPELVPQPRYSMALPEELNVPLFLPAGPSTGRVSSLLSPEEQPQGLIPMITQPERFTDPPTWDPTTVTSGQPFVYWHPLMKPGSRPLPAGGSLGIQLYDRFLNGGYGNTDIDGQRQVIINAAQQIPGDAGPFNP